MKKPFNIKKKKKKVSSQSFFKTSWDEYCTTINFTVNFKQHLTKSFVGNGSMRLVLAHVKQGRYSVLDPKISMEVVVFDLLMIKSLLIVFYPLLNNAALLA